MTEATNNTSGQPRKVQVSAEPLRQVLHALINAPHLIRELQATREPAALFADNPINVLIAEFEAGFAAPPAAAVVVPQERCVECAGVTQGCSGEAKWCCYCGAKLVGDYVARLNPAPVESAMMVPEDVLSAMTNAMLALESWNSRYPRLAKRGDECSSEWAEYQLRRLLPGYREAIAAAPTPVPVLPISAQREGGDHE